MTNSNFQTSQNLPSRTVWKSIAIVGLGICFISIFTSGFNIGIVLGYIVPLTAIFCFSFEMAIGKKYLWQGYLFVFPFLRVYQIYANTGYHQQLATTTNISGFVLWAVVTDIIIALLLCYGLFIYSFRSDAIWNNDITPVSEKSN